MFERFTDRARRVLVLAQEEARLLNHSFIGTEHILLGLILEGEGVAAQVIERLGVSLDDVRAKVDEIVAPAAPVTGSPSFTPRAKAVLELSLREALQLGHNHIGTEHVLLGLVREGEGVAAQVLVSLGLDLARVRGAVVHVLSEYRGTPSVAPGRARGELVACSFCGRRPPESGRLVAGRGGAYVCEHCVSELTDRFAVDPDDDPEATPPTVVLTGRRPDDEEAARSAIARAFGQALVLSPDRRTVPSVEGGDLLGPCLKEAQERHASLRHSDGAVIIDHIEFVDETHASVLFAVAREGLSADVRRGEAVVVDTTWKMARATFCALMTLAGVTCPPPT